MIDAIILIASLLLAAPFCERPVLAAVSIMTYAIYDVIINPTIKFNKFDDKIIKLIVWMMTISNTIICVLIVSYVIFCVDQAIDWLICKIQRLLPRAPPPTPPESNEECCICFDDTKNKRYLIMHNDGKMPHNDPLCDKCRAKLTKCPLCRQKL